MTCNYSNEAYKYILMFDGDTFILKQIDVTKLVCLQHCFVRGPRHQYHKILISTENNNNRVIEKEPAKTQSVLCQCEDGYALQLSFLSNSMLVL